MAETNDNTNLLTTDEIAARLVEDEAAARGITADELLRRRAIALRLQQLNDEGGLRHADVVADARDPGSPLHRHFDWEDDSEEGDQRRLRQVESLILGVDLRDRPDIADNDPAARHARLKALYALEEDIRAKINEQLERVPHVNMSGGIMRMRVACRVFAEMIDAYERRYIRGDRQSIVDDVNQRLPDDLQLRLVDEDEDEDDG